MNKYHIILVILMFICIQVFADIAPELNIEPSNISRKKFLGRGAFGTVFAGEMKQDDKVIPVALKMPLDNDVGENPTEEEIAAKNAAERKVQEVPRQIFTEAYRCVPLKQRLIQHSVFH